MQTSEVSPRERFAVNQQELAAIRSNKSPFTEEWMEHPLCEAGFVSGNPLTRMPDDIFYQAISTLLKARPSARLWDITPTVPYKETALFLEDPRAFKMSFDEKAQFLTEEFLRRPQMEGFRIELHNIGSTTGPADSGKAASVSIWVYETEDLLEDTCVPVKIKVRYRTTF